MLRICFDDPQASSELARIDDALLRDLAGNAFDSSSFLAVWQCLVALLARCERARADRARAKWPQVALTDRCGSGYDSDPDPDSDSDAFDVLFK